MAGGDCLPKMNSISSTKTVSIWVTYTKGNYWSATEEGKNSAMVQNFANGNQSKSN